MYSGALSSWNTCSVLHSCPIHPQHVLRPSCSSRRGALRTIVWCLCTPMWGNPAVEQTCIPPRSFITRLSHAVYLSSLARPGLTPTRQCEATLGFRAEGCGRGGTRVVRLGLRSEASSRVRSGNGGPGDRDGNIPTSSISVVHRTEWWSPLDTPSAFRPLPPSDVPPASFLRG